MHSSPNQLGSENIRRYLPWIVATAMFMEQLDSTIINTAVPYIAENLNATPLSIKSVISSYILSLAVCIPVSSWMADRFGTRRVFFSAMATFTIASLLCAASSSVSMLIAARILQGIGAAMMIPVGRLSIVRSFPKIELQKAMNFVIIPALTGALLGPTIGGLIVQWLPWQMIFFINIPVGVAALLLGCRHMPDYFADNPPPFDLTGLALFGTGTVLLSYLLEIFGEHQLSKNQIAPLLFIALGLIGAYVWHAQHSKHPLLHLALFRIRTFRTSLVGGTITRLSIGGLPFLLPLLYQLGFGFPAWKAGLLMIPAAIAAMGMKMFAGSMLLRFGFPKVLTVNSLLIGITISLFAFISSTTPLPLIIFISLALGLFNSLQISSMNSLVYADIETKDVSMASAITSSIQQLSISFGLAAGSLLTSWHLGASPQSEQAAISTALHHTFLTLSCLTLLSSLAFWTLKDNDGRNLNEEPHEK